MKWKVEKLIRDIEGRVKEEIIRTKGLREDDERFLFVSSYPDRIIKFMRGTLSLYQPVGGALLTKPDYQLVYSFYLRRESALKLEVIEVGQYEMETGKKS